MSAHAFMNLNRAVLGRTGRRRQTRNAPVWWTAADECDGDGIEALIGRIGAGVVATRHDDGSATLAFADSTFRAKNQQEERLLLLTLASLATRTERVFGRAPSAGPCSLDRIEMIDGEAGYQAMTRLLTRLIHVEGLGVRDTLTIRITVHCQRRSPDIVVQIDGRPVSFTLDHMTTTANRTVVIVATEIVATFAPHFRGRTGDGGLDWFIDIEAPRSAVLRATRRRTREEALNDILDHLVRNDCGTEAIALIKESIAA